MNVVDEGTGRAVSLNTGRAVSVAAWPGWEVSEGWGSWVITEGAALIVVGVGSFSGFGAKRSLCTMIAVITAAIIGKRISSINFSRVNGLFDDERGMESAP